jgi:hypothetical protein
MKLQIVAISLWCYGQYFFKFGKQKFSFQISKKIFFQNFHGDINNFFLDPRLPNLFKIYKNYLFTLTKRSHILHKSTIKESVKNGYKV